MQSLVSPIPVDSRGGILFPSLLSMCPDLIVCGLLFLPGCLQGIFLNLHAQRKAVAGCVTLCVGQLHTHPGRAVEYKREHELSSSQIAK